MSVPAFAIVGIASTLISTSSTDAGQDPLVIVHWNVFVPIPNPVTGEVAEVGVVIVPLPETSVQIPEPIVGMFPFNKENEAQIVESNPALAIVIDGFTINETVSEEVGHVPFEIVHTKVFSPVLIPVIEEVGEVGVVIIPLPVTTVQLPIPIPGILPFKEEDEKQMIESIPALALVGKGSIV